jgi:predicted RNA-binding protein with PUA-like domain
MSAWLVKSEPDVYSFADLVRDKKTVWDGVRNFAARNNLRAMKKGDVVLYYHSGDEKQVVGIARVAKAAYPDPSAKEGVWSAVDLTPVKAFSRAVTLAAIKATPKLSDFKLVKQGRLSVVPVAARELAELLKLGATKL